MPFWAYWIFFNNNSIQFCSSISSQPRTNNSFFDPGGYYPFHQKFFFALSLSNQTLCEVLVFFRRAKNRLDGEKVWSQKSFCENNLWPKKNRTGQAGFGSSKVWPLVFSSAIKQEKFRPRVGSSVGRPSFKRSRVSVQLYWREFESQLRHNVVGTNPSSAICWTSK